MGVHNLSQSSFHGQLIFKGGTSLSKAWKLINRFSEDVDLAAHVRGMSGNQIKQFIREAEATLVEGLSYTPDHPAESKHGSFRKTWHSYPRWVAGDFGQAMPLEINAFTTPEPFIARCNS
ncbi:nucleotidyl transferase AbiEii/AbiGii toxin family protein [Pantoea phytobeneficialis]|uniref:Nucleotidyl transferase AbiEii/AbiGii toxin family protein n=1 Tax=Pantoea phytobeneficialis TaxID=2052056 RepID=A0ABT8XRF3_9GAMM|nr:nucleotidyl transferase AbiEii/AbiGii toxin family protein [Pantoea phytobeneficialis]MDO6405663.1 nucleotidyl transferase AbiEii/AbiGii toxin family protein [Pantoea phytobeneficialis]